MNSSFKLNVLAAYPYMGNPLVARLAEHADSVRFLLDSGAFTAFNAGKVITVDEYCSFIEALPITPWRYFALDVIADPEATRRNYETMLERGFNPIPVLTPGQPLDDIDKYYETTDLIGCGGLVDKFGPRSLRYLRDIVERVGDRKLHLLGYTTPEYVKYFRPYSCDSSSWMRVQRYGQMDVYLGQGRYGSWRRSQATYPPPPEIDKALRVMGFDVSQFSQEEAWRGDNAAAQVSCRSWVKYSLDAEQAIGTKLFLAVGNVSMLDSTLQAFEWWHAPVSA